MYACDKAVPLLVGTATIIRTYIGVHTYVLLDNGASKQQFLSFGEVIVASISTLLDSLGYKPSRFPITFIQKVLH